MGGNTADIQRVAFGGLGPLVLADTPGGRDALRELVDPLLRDMVDELSPVDAAALSHDSAGTAIGETTRRARSIC